MLKYFFKDLVVAIDIFLRNKDYIALILQKDTVINLKTALESRSI